MVTEVAAVFARRSAWDDNAMPDVSTTVVPMETEHTDRVLSPRAALLVCAAAAVLGWIGVAGAVFLGKALIGSWQDVDVAGDTVSTIAPAAGNSGAPTVPAR